MFADNVIIAFKRKPLFITIPVFVIKEIETTSLSIKITEGYSCFKCLFGESRVIQ
jgi:hypothetical protein